MSSCTLRNIIVHQEVEVPFEASALYRSLLIPICESFVTQPHRPSTKQTQKRVY